MRSLPALVVLELGEPYVGSILSVAAAKEFKIHQVDIKTSFFQWGIERGAPLSKTSRFMSPSLQSLIMVIQVWSVGLRRPSMA